MERPMKFKPGDSITHNLGGSKMKVVGIKYRQHTDNMYKVKLKDSFYDTINASFYTK